MTLHLVTFIYDVLCAKCCVIYILIDRIKSNQIRCLNGSYGEECNEHQNVPSQKGFRNKILKRRTGKMLLNTRMDREPWDFTNEEEISK